MKGNNTRCWSAVDIILSFFHLTGVRGGPLFDTTRAWFNFLRIIVSIMKRGYEEPQEIVEEDGLVKFCPMFNNHFKFPK